MRIHPIVPKSMCQSRSMPLICVLLTFVVMLAGFDAARDTLLAQMPASATAWEKLQQAMQLHVQARTERQLEQAVELAEAALAEGLGEEDAQLARQLVASCLLQKAQRQVSRLGRSRFFGPSWQTLRDRALEDLEKAVRYVPDLAEGYRMIAELCLLPGGDRERGLECANQLIQLAQEDPSAQAEAYALRARFQEDPDKQREDLKLAAESDPRNVQIRRLYGQLLSAQGRRDEAEAVFRDLVRDDPDQLPNLLALIELLLQQEGKLDDALELANRAVELDKESTQALLVRASIFMAKDDYDSALRDVEEAVKRNPRDIRALLLRAQLYLVKDNPKAALTDVESVLRIQPGLVVAIRMRAEINAYQKKYVEAIQDMELLIQHDPNNAEYKLQLAYYCMADDRPRKAIKILTEIIENDDQNWRALRARGDALLSIGKHAEAIQDYNRALALKSDDSHLLNNLAWVLATSPEDSVRNGRRALELARKACELTDYKEAHILSTLASAYAELGDFQSAIQWSMKAVELGENDEQKEQLKKELETYRQGKPFREKQETKEKPDIPKKNLLET